MTPENRVKSKVKKLLDAYKAYYFFPAMGVYGRAGVPDIVGCIDGAFFGIECKAGKNKATALQLYELQKIAGADGFAMVLREEDLNVLESFLRGPRNHVGYKNTDGGDGVDGALLEPRPRCAATRPETSTGEAPCLRKRKK